MKKKNYSIYLRIATVCVGCFSMLASCNKEMASITDSPKSDIPAEVRVLSLGIDEAPQGRATATVPTSGQVGFFMASDNGYTAAHNKPGGYTSGAWSPNNQLWLSSNVATLAIYYPYAAAFGTTKAEIPMTASLRTDDSKDICAAKFTANNQSVISKVTMTQIYSRLVIKVIKSSDYVGAGTWTAVSLDGNEVYTSGVYNPIAETYTGNKAKFSSAGFSKTLGTSSSAGDVASVDMLLVPGSSMTGDLTIDLTVDTRPLRATIASLPEGKFTPGKVQTIVLTVSPLGLIINQVSTADWNDASGGDYTVGVVPPAPAPPGINVSASDINLGGAGCTDTDKSDLAKLTWAVGNLRQQGDDGTGSTIMTSSQSEYGHYYTWNSTYTGNTSSTGTDPCSTLGASTYGAGWRTPNKNELEKLSRCTDQQLVVYNSVKGMWFMNNTKGLFLPAAGVRNSGVGSGTTPTSDARTGGYYWSSAASNSSNAYNLSFSSGLAYVGYINKAFGFPVRCVQGDKQ